MKRYGSIALIVCLSLSLPALGQQSTKEALAQGQLDTLMQAQQVLASAEQAGAPTLATTLYDEAQWRLRFARENWSSTKSSVREQARMRSNEAVWAGRAALAKARWLGTNTAILGLQDDIRHFGGSSDLLLTDEPATIALSHGNTSKDRIAVAQKVIDQAKAAGAERITGNELVPAQQNINTAKKIIEGDSTSEAADHLAYVAEMMARRAFYLSRLADVEPRLGPLQLERTRLAQVESDRLAAEQRAQREAAELQAAQLRQQLANEQMNRQAQQTELDRLNQQIAENQRLFQQRIDEDRAARERAEKQLDDFYRQYQTAMTSSSTGDVESLRRQIEDQELSLKAIQERQRLNEQALATEVTTLKSELDKTRQDGQASAQAIAEREAAIARREADLERLRRERAEDDARRMELEKQQQTAVLEAQQRRQQAEEQAQQLRQQMEAAQQSAQQSAAEVQQLRQQQVQTQTELDRLKLQNELSRLAATRVESRGLIVTLPGIFFDTGKSQLKAGAKNTLSKIAEQLKSTSVQISVEGHTDSVGSEDSNQTLSDARANAVRAYLVSVGIPSSSITAMGRGEMTPVATNKTAAGRQQNRRVELVITQ
ncbi:MAG TPA: OmpA family protein [Thermoanaerobaculia bacterium]|nr:OmpA family protein [Thermoanaerobaculia bacterium]